MNVAIQNGQITVPVELRLAWGLRDGDKIVVEMADDGVERAVLRPARSVTDMTYGAFKSHLPPPTAQEFNQMFEDAVVDEYLAETPHAVDRRPLPE
jgi:bifunctional DNA-binding transcriptional regulator/antitoxin component of YhaV-PrlF toxin-antitoxin module